MLKDYGATLVIGEAEDGLEALHKARELEPDLILLDIGLPRLNGFEVARQVRQSVPKVKIIFITANNDADFVTAAFDMGAEGYIFKDHVARCLTRAITAVLHGGHYLSSQS